METAKILRYIARYTLLIFGVLVFVFALLSGSETFGGGIKGILKNSPNAIPWLILLVLVVVAWKWELVGGILITLLGIAALIFFGIFSANFSTGTLIICLIPFVLGSFLILSWWLSRETLRRRD
jgi:hypothetical protein